MSESAYQLYARLQLIRVGSSHTTYHPCPLGSVLLPATGIW